ncbi:MAG: tetratricopeptide repeat protein [Bacteroidota bacterium]
MKTLKIVLLLIFLHLSVLNLNANNWLNRGEAYLSNSEFDRALDSFTKALDENPYDIQAYIYRAKIHAFRGHYQKAMDDYNSALDLNPDLIKVIMKKRSLDSKQNKLELDKLPQPTIITTEPNTFNFPRKSKPDNL